jgi:hypothetical protein
MKCDNQYRQGEVFLVRVDELPKGLVKKDRVLAEGETTGHKHQFLSSQVSVFEDSDKNQFCELKKDSELIHDEHTTVQIPKGKYKVVLQREYDVVQGIRQVMD